MPTRCQEHNENMKLYCDKCKCPVCYLCRDYGNHKGHEINLISVSAQQIQNEIRNYIQKTQSLVNGLDEYLKELNSYISTLRKNKIEKEEQID